MPARRSTMPIWVVAGATAVQAGLLVVWSARMSIPSLVAGVLGFAAITALIALALVCLNTFEARLAAALLATASLALGVLVVTIGLPTLPAEPSNPVALLSIAAGLVAYVGLELDRRSRARRAARRGPSSTYAA